MMKRMTWFAAGAAAGVAGASYATKKVKQQAAKLTPSNVARSAADKTRSGGRHVVDALRDGRATMKAREAELKARRDHHIEPLDGRLEPGEQVLVDGQPVDSGRVIVLKQRA